MLFGARSAGTAGAIARSLARGAQRRATAVVAHHRSRRPDRVTDASSATTSGKVTAIVEQKDATPAQRAVREINTGVLGRAHRGLHPLAGTDRESRNAKSQYYLTDVVGARGQKGSAVETTQRTDVIETLGVEQPARSGHDRAAVPTAQADALLDAGVTSPDPARIDVRGTLVLRA